MGWAFSRTNSASANFDSSFTGYGGYLPTINTALSATTGQAFSTTKSADPITITLDTSQVDWVWTVDFNNNGVDRTETFPLVPNINFVGYSMNGPIGASTVDNFLLTRVDRPRRLTNGT